MGKYYKVEQIMNAMLGPREQRAALNLQAASEGPSSYIISYTKSCTDWVLWRVRTKTSNYIFG